MSIPTLQGLQTALSGLIANQEAIDTTGHNITNANTPGYSRQTAVMQTNTPLPIAAMSQLTGAGGQMGTGVTVTTFERVRNVYLDQQYRTQNAALGSATAEANELKQAQSAFDEPSSSGISSQMSAFWSAWSSLANDPSSEAAREGVVSTGKQLATTLNQLNGQLETISAQATQQYTAITGATGEVQDDANQIAQLNHQIQISEAAGQNPNDLLDRRDELLDKLSELGNTTVTKAPDGTDTVTFGDAAKPLVEGTTVNWPQELTAAAGGQLGALLKVSSPTGPLAAYREALNEVADDLTSSVNALHTSTPFFTGTTAATIKVAVTPAEVQSAGNATSGGNEVAQAIANLRGGTADQRYAGLIAQVGSDVQTAEDDQSTSQAVVSAIGSQRESVSGVSLDEEMTNLISFQRGYEASARTLTAMDQMLETLIDHTGSAGM
jgi:flagellar hook-associated protein 1 FlgK